MDAIITNLKKIEIENIKKAINIFKTEKHLEIICLLNLVAEYQRRTNFEDTIKFLND